MSWFRKYKISSYSHYNKPSPFKDWFDESQRFYLPFTPVNANEGADEYLESELSDNGFVITNYPAGHCEKGGRTYRIGRVLQELKNKALEELNTQFANGEIYNLEREVKESVEYYDGLMSEFMHSPYRSNKNSNSFSIVISCKPKDVENMSTGRRWTSCMDIEDGSHSKDVYCEIEHGSLVAYLIKSDDVDIEDPISRVSIKRFDNRFGKSIAVAEDSVYGDDVAGFLSSVRGWLRERQPNITPGDYVRKGGEHSDTFNDSFLVAPENEDDIIKWLKGEGEDAKYSTWFVEDELFDDIGDLMIEQEGLESRKKEFNTLEEAEQYKNSLHDEDYEREYADNAEEWLETDEDGDFVKDRYVVWKRDNDNTLSMKRNAVEQILAADVGVYSKEILEEVKNYIFQPLNQYGRSDLRQKFMKKYPDMIDYKESDLSVKEKMEFIKNLPEDQKAPYLEGWKKQSEFFMDDPELLISNSAKERFEREFPESPTETFEDYFNTGKELPDIFLMELSNSIHSHILNPLTELFKPIPEDLIQKLIGFVSNLSKYNLTTNRPVNGRAEDYGKKIHANLTHTFLITHSDTPSVQRYYESLLPHWGDGMARSKDFSEINISNLGAAIGKLGENGTQFLPFMRDKLEKAKNKVEEIKEKESIFMNSDKEHRTRVLDNGEVMGHGVLKFYEKEVEQYLSIIDSIESGKGYSRKYRFYASNWYRMIKASSR
jgi:hypothetical protein